MSLQEGTIIGGSYRIEHLVAKGGMGLVYLATHVRLRRKVALKVMLPQFVEFKEQIARFLNEALGVADVHHRNIVDIMDVGTTSEGLPFFVMEFLEGETLRTRLKRKDKMAPMEAARIMIQALAGLSVLHARGIVHRDMKPSNIFISREEDGTEIVKLLDFGVSKFHLLEGDNMVELTTTGTILGTPSYMSPEQARGKRNEIDLRSDLYSCGLILYRCLTGLNPFRGDNYNETIVNILTADVPKPSFFVPDLPAGLDSVVLKAVDRDKEKRYQSCRTYIDGLKSIIGSQEGAEAIDALHIEIEFSDAEAAGDQSRVPPPGSGIITLSRFSRKWVIPAAAVAVAALVLAVLGISGLLGGRNEANPDDDGSGGKNQKMIQVSNVQAPPAAGDASSDGGELLPDEWGNAGGEAVEEAMEPPAKPGVQKHKQPGKKKVKKGSYIFKEFPE